MSGETEHRAEIEALQRRVAELERTVAEQERFKGALGESEAKLRALLESASQGIVVIDRAGRIALVNAQLEAMFDYPREALLGQPLEILVPADLRRVHVEHRARYAAAPHPRPMGQGIELTGQRNDGSRFPVEISLSYTEADGDMLFIGFVTDISGRKRTEEALRRSETQAQAVLEAASESIVIVDERGRIVSVNRKTEEMFGYPRAQLLGETLEILLPERLRPTHAEHRVAYFRHPRVRPGGHGLDLLARRHDGREFPVEISLSYVRPDEGLQALAFITDITERQALERASRQTDRLSALGELSAGVAHEVNNPIGIMTTRIELMLMDADSNGLPAETVEDLRVLHRHAQRVATITKSLLSFARQSPRERSLVDLNEVVGTVLVLVGKQYERQGVRVVQDLQPSLPRVFGHANALEQVVLNLVTNAAQAMEAGGEIRIATSADERTLRLVVADDGTGIAPDDLMHIFEPFFTTKAAGTGLGLAVTYGILEDHNASVDVESAPGHGTRFIVSFPLVAPDPAG